MFCGSSPIGAKCSFLPQRLTIIACFMSSLSCSPSLFGKHNALLEDCGIVARSRRHNYGRWRRGMSFQYCYYLGCTEHDKQSSYCEHTMSFLSLDQSFSLTLPISHGSLHRRLHQDIAWSVFSISALQANNLPCKHCCQQQQMRESPLER
jgi:hypothetical protein